MDKVRVYHDRAGNTLTVWFEDPAREQTCDEVDDDVVVMNDRKGRLIGFELLNYQPKNRCKTGQDR